MKYFKIYSLFILLGLISCQSEDVKIYIAEIEQQRIEKNETYSDSLKSPLNPIYMAKFEGLNYFKVDPNFNIEGTLELTPEEKPFEMATSTDRVPVYRKYANLHFKVKGEDFVLGVFQNMDYINDSVYKNNLFIPFQDLTSSKEAYGGGRYIDIQIPDTDQVMIDFNLAYNPYCTYDDRWSCVIPPPENFLEVRILAGEKKFHLTDH
jgi:hypothetical protein